MFLGPEDDWVEDDRRILFELAQQHLGHIHTFIYDINDIDYVTSVHASPDAVERILHAEGFERNLISARKCRQTEGGKQYAHGSWAKYYGDENDHQHHVFIFENEHGGTDIYAHYEDNATDSAAHLHVRDDEDDIKGMKRAYAGDLYGIFDKRQLDYGKKR